MYFTVPALLTILTASVAVAAPTPGDHKPSYNKDQYKKDCKEDWDHKWEDDSWKKDEKIFYFDKEFYVMATPNQVINSTGTPTPGQSGAKGIFKYGINIAENTICYNITLSGVTGGYQSLAATATHIHQADVGKAGPPRIAFPNPTGPDSRRVSYGCLSGPFFTKTNNTAGVDNGANFHVREIVANPSNFFTDTHTSSFVQGAVRGQFA